MHFGPFRWLSQKCQELVPPATRSTTDLGPRAPESPTPDPNFSNQWARHLPHKGFAESRLVTQPCLPGTSSLYTRDSLAMNEARGQQRLPDCSQLIDLPKEKDLCSAHRGHPQSTEFWPPDGRPIRCFLQKATPQSLATKPTYQGGTQKEKQQIRPNETTEEHAQN